MLDGLKKYGSPDTAWAGSAIVCYDETDSTNRRARELARSGAAHGTLVIAEQQTQGRGRRGRSWISPAGDGIFMSLIVRRKDAQGAARLSLVIALAVARAIAGETGLYARIKWPNDIVIGGRKVCGMRCEMDFMEDGGLAVTAGIGINVHQTVFDEEIAQTASSLDLLSGRRLDRSSIVLAFLREMEAALALEETDADAFMQAYCAHSATLGSRVQVIAPDKTYTGMAEGITPGGTLLVRADEDGQLREVLAADVSVRGIMGYA